MSEPQKWSAPVTDVPPGTSAKFLLWWRGTKVEGFVVNFEGRYHAYVNRCAHAGTPLDWWPNEFFTDDGRLLVCATHGALYEPDSGRCAGGPCGGAALWPLVARREGDRVIVSVRPEDADAASGS
jgi:nitrite reductase/ring-hydroxylating ferredoxin subunit